MQGRSIINPNFMRAFYIHYGSLGTGHNATYPVAKCMLFVHVVHMVRAGSGTPRRGSGGKEQTLWGAHAPGYLSFVEGSRDDY